MTKNLLCTALGLMGLMGTLPIGVVNAEITITHYTGSNISYTLNGNELFTGVGTITITDGTDTITILDRNLGAKKAGTGCDKNTNGGYCPYDDTYGYHFQWGNNHGFKPGCDLSGSTNDCSDTISSGAVDGQVDAITISYNPASQEFYNSGVFYKGYSNWLTDNSKVDLWGGSTGGTDTITSTYSLNGDNWKVDESTVTNRQGPCPEGFHVPSYGELQKLENMLNADGKRNKDTLRDKLLIPFAGFRSYYDASVYDMGNYASLWSSSLYWASNPTSQSLYLDVDGYLFMIDYNRANALSVRCFYDSYQPFTQSFTLSFMSGDMVLGTGEVVEDKVYTGDIPNVTETGYILEYRYLSGVDATTGFDFENEAITGGMANEEGVVYFIAKWTPVEYAITFVDGSGTETTVVYSGNYETAVSTDYPNWTRDGYTISWDKPIPPTMPLNGDTITASWTENKKPSGGSSGGGGRSSSKDVISNDSEKSSEQPAGSQVDSSEQAPQNDNSNTQDSQQSEQTSANTSEGQNQQQFTQEFQEAYKFAKGKGITTMPTIQKADMDGKLTRIAMAKMLSQYAMNVLGQKPANIVTPKFKDVTDKQNSDYDDGVTLAYQLGIMGLNVPDNKFRPNDEVTRAEFATALSRMIYNTSDGEYKSTPKYYIHHMEKLVKEGIITNDNPNMKELRGYVMIMLMRSAGK